MSRGEQPETQEIREKVLAFIQRNPGVTLERITVAMGLTVGTDSKRRRRYPDVIKKAIAQLRNSGAIRMEREQFATVKEPMKCYPADYQPPRKRPLFQPGYVPPLKTWIDPTIAGTAPATPVRSAMEDFVISPNPRPKEELEEMTGPAYKQKLQAFKYACDSMVEQNERLALMAVCRRAGLHSNWGHTQAEAKAYYQGAIAKLNRLQGQAPEAVEEPEQPPEPEAPAPVPPVEPASDLAATVALEEELHRLKAELEAKTRRLSELEWEVEESDRELEMATAYAKDLEARLSQAEPTSDPYPWILQQRDLWGEQVSELAKDLAAAEKNFKAFCRLADLYEIPTEETNGTTDHQVSSDDRNNTGGDGDHPAPADAELSQSQRNGRALAGSSALD